MDLKNLSLLVSQCAPLWDRSHERFRDLEYKAILWNKIATELNTTDTACKEAYKGLREKYIREREKYGPNSKPWELLEYLQFLDPHINTRKSGSTSGYQHEEHVSVKQDPLDSESFFREDAEAETNIYDETENPNKIFFKTLIKMVHQTRALWDRNYKDYSDKPLKEQLWRTIASSLNSDATTCSLKWKGLREKYIRQKQKHSEGDFKWEFLDDLAFLDNVILYRKKHWKPEETNSIYHNNDILSPNIDYEFVDDGTNESTSTQVPTSNHKQTLPSQLTHVPDSTLEISNTSSRKRTFSNASETSCHNTKKNRASEERTPEQVFGEFVAVMLATKSDNEKKLAMMEMMTILTRPCT